MTYNELMGKIGEMLELEDFEPDADGMCMLIGEEGGIFFQHMPEADLVLTTATVCELEEAPDREFLCRLLEANLMWRETMGSTLALDADERRVVLARYDRVSTLDPERFILLINNFLTTLSKIGEWDRTMPLSEEAQRTEGAEGPRAGSPARAPVVSMEEARAAVLAGAIVV